MATPSNSSLTDEVLSSPDPLNASRDSALLPSSRRVTRSQRSQSFMSLGRSSSPRKQSFALQIGDARSPHRLFVTVEAEGGEEVRTSRGESTARKLFQPSTDTDLRKGGDPTTITSTTTVPLRDGDAQGAITPKRRGRPRKDASPMKQTPGRRRSNNHASPVKRTPGRTKSAKKTAELDELTPDTTTDSAIATKKRATTTAKKTPSRSRRTKAMAPEDEQASLDAGNLSTFQSTSTKQTRERRADSAAEDDQPSSAQATKRPRGRPRRLALIPEDFNDLIETNGTPGTSLRPTAPEHGMKYVAAKDEEEMPATIEPRIEYEDLLPPVPMEMEREGSGDRFSRPVAREEEVRLSAQETSQEFTREPSQDPTASEPDLWLSLSEEATRPVANAGDKQRFEPVSDAGAAPRSETGRALINDAVEHASEGLDTDDTVAQGEDFSMIFAHSIPSLRGDTSFQPMETHDFGEATSLIINKTLEELRQSLNGNKFQAATGAETVNGHRDGAAPGLSEHDHRESVAEQTGSPEISDQKSDAAETTLDHVQTGMGRGTQGPSLDSDKESSTQNGMPEESPIRLPQLPPPAPSPKGSSPTLSRVTPRSKKDIPLSQQLLKSKALQAMRSTAADSPLRPGSDAIIGVRSDDSWSSIPEDVLTRMAPGYESPKEAEPVSGPVPESAPEPEPEPEAVPEAEPEAEHQAQHKLEDGRPEQHTESTTTALPHPEPAPRSPTLSEEAAAYDEDSFSTIPDEVLERAAPTSAALPERSRRGEDRNSPDRPAQRSPTLSEEAAASDHSLSSDPAKVLKRAPAGLPLHSDATEVERAAETPAQKGHVELPPQGKITAEPNHGGSQLLVPRSAESGSRPSLSPIVRAGRALQTVTSDASSPPSRQQSLGSPFRASTSAKPTAVPPPVSEPTASEHGGQAADDTEDIWGVEARRETNYRRPRQQPFGKHRTVYKSRPQSVRPSSSQSSKDMDQQKPERPGFLGRLSIPSPWKNRQQGKPTATPATTARSNTENRDALVNYSILSQNKTQQQSPLVKAQDNGQTPRRFDLSAFFSSPRFLPGMENAQAVLKRKRESMAAQEDEKEDGGSAAKRPHVLQTTTMFPEAPRDSSVGPERNAVGRRGSLMSREDIEKWQQESSMVESSSPAPGTPTRELRPLPDRNASPTKSCLRSPLKPRTPGRVVVFDKEALSPLDQARVRQEREAAAAQQAAFERSLRASVDQGQDHGLRGPVVSLAPPTMATEDGDVEMTDVSEYAEEEEEDERSEEEESADEVQRPTAPTPVRSRQPTRKLRLSKVVWTKDHWVRMDELVRERRKGPFRFDFPADFESKSGWLVGQTISSHGEKLVLNPWHLSVIDAFKADVGGVWDELTLARRLFGVIVADGLRKEGREPRVPYAHRRRR